MGFGSDPDKVVRLVVEALTGASIPYMLTGSMASSAHGAPRTTQGVDFVIEPSDSGLTQLLASLPADRFYVSETAAREALRRRTLFNAVDRESGWKIDFVVRKERPFSRTEFERRRKAVVVGVPLYVASPEDVILIKLEWAKRSGSERQIADAAGVMKAQRGRLDSAYLERWIAELDVAKEWRAAEALATPPP